MHLRHAEVEHRAHDRGLVGRLGGEKVAMQAMARIFASRRLYEAAQRSGRLVQLALAHSGKIEHLPGPLNGWTTARDLPGGARRELPRLVATVQMSEAREQILARIRSALGDVPSDEQPSGVTVPREYRRRVSIEPSDLVARFEDGCGTTARRVNERRQRILQAPSQVSVPSLAFAAS